MNKKTIHPTYIEENIDLVTYREKYGNLTPVLINHFTVDAMKDIWST